MTEQVEHITETSARGSALILTVVLTSLLAIVGVLFVMAARIDKMATTATTESRELNCAVDTILARIDQALAEDVPGVSPDQEYYDYPDELNPWLADLEPYAVQVGTDSKGDPKYEYRWRQISNVGSLASARLKDVPIALVGERDRIVPGNTDPNADADADGDGVGDARWFEVPGTMTSKGKPFYAAVRIIDNSAMLNMNTGFKFDPADPCAANVDGTSPLHVNVLALAAGPGSAPTTADEKALLGARANRNASPAATADLPRYEREAIWQYMDVKNPSLTNPSPYTPFDISDEMELRYRYLLNHKDMTSRVEDCGLFKGKIWTPVDDAKDLATWGRRAAGGGADDYYIYRHVATTYNMDRILTPKPLSLSNGTTRRKMVNVNTADELTLQTAIKAALRETDPNADPSVTAQTAAQITANLRDYLDDDDEVTVILGQSSHCYGFERPCIYISEIACRRVQDASTGAIHSSYAIELHRPYFEDKDPPADQWKLQIHRSSGADVELPLVWTGSRRFHVVLAEDPAARLSESYVVFTDPEEPLDTMPRFGYNRSDYTGKAQDAGAAGFEFGADDSISLWRSVPTPEKWISVDFVRVPSGWIQIDDVARSLQRDISPHKCVRRLWASAGEYSTPALGNAIGNYVDTKRPEMIQAHPANRSLRNIGELGMVFRENVYSLQEGTVAAGVLVDLGNPTYSRLFNYLTVIDPARYQPPGLPDTETRVMGRININTAPAFVLAQLPWIRYQEGAEFKRAQDIVDHRIANGVSNPYRSIGDLMQVISLRDLGYDVQDNQHANGGPDLTPDTALDDFEERDLLFTRISDLVTVRSDVFTAYVLVRIGTEGPQKRIVATFDRSRVDAAGGQPRLFARHPVPDPR